jgi:ribosomal protein S18 acetylase RimI-like enzyme
LFVYGPMTVALRILKSGDEAVFDRVAEGVFDDAIEPALVREFLADPHHHIAVAIDEGLLVGFASGVDYIHPDKPRELFVNEVGVAPTHLRKGIGKRVLGILIVSSRCSSNCRCTAACQAPAVVPIQSTARMPKPQLATGPPEA